ncbi:MAG TPA: galactokinase family protein [Tepidisphaeraceae bacterium]|jgi:galactokinase
MISWHDRLIQSGMTAEQANAKQLLLQKCFAALGTDNVASVVYAPGRVEFLGKHTDYCGGRSLLCTVDRGLIVAATRGDSNTIRITETSSGESVEFSGTADLQPRSDHWSNYPMTVVRRLAQNFGTLHGTHIAIASDLPRAAGLSSSSALVVALFLLFSKLNNLPAHPSYSSNIHTLEDLSGYLGCVENGQNFKNLPGDRGVGTFGGSQDHTAILCSKPDALVQYRFAPVVHERTIPFPKDYTLAISVSGVVAEKTGAAKEKYNQISLRAAEILRRWNSATSRHDPTLAAALSSLDAEEKMTNLVRDDQELSSRLMQFIRENRFFVPNAGDALLENRLKDLGEIIASSQFAAEEMLGNQIPETIFLAHQARALGASAASAFGAGFGGSVWAMIPIGNSEKFLADWKHAYVTQFPQHSERCEFFASRPCIPAMSLL